MSRSAAASAKPDIVGLGPVGVSVTGLDSAWAPSLALALGPLDDHPGPAALVVREEPWGFVDRAADGGNWLDIGAELRLRSDRNGLVVHDRRSAVACRFAGGEVVLSTQSGEPGAAGRVLPFCLAPPLLDAGALLVHAATIGSGSHALLAMGPTGAGKSTTVAAARSVGLRVLGDDLAVVWRDGSWRVHGLARPVRVAAELAPGAPPVPADVRGRVSPEGWVTGGTADLCGAVLVRHGGAGQATAAGPVAVARSVVAAAFATALPRCVAPSLAIGRGLAELPGWDLALDADPGQRLASAGRDLADLLARC